MTRPSAAAMQTYAAVFEPRGRVIACTECARAVQWRGHKAAHRDGWTCLGAGGLAWTCDGCGGETEAVQ